MTEEAPLTPPADESQRIEDPEKARVMARAGEDDRGQAADARAAANLYQNLTQEHGLNEENDPDLREAHERHLEDLREEADSHDAIADMDEDRAGREYVAEQASEPESAAPESAAAAPETDQSSKEVEELVNLYRDLVMHDSDSPYLAYLRNNIIHNEQYATDNPEKAKEIYTRLAASDNEALRIEAVFQFVSMLKIDKTLALDTMRQLISGVETIETVSETLDSLVDQNGNLREEAQSLTPEEIKSLLRAYADRLVRRQE